MSVTVENPLHQEFLDSNWYLAYTKPRSEAVACAQLVRQTFDAYLPMYKTMRRVSGSMQAHRSAMFPRYVFFRPRRPGQSIAPVRSTMGISSIVRNGVTPATVRDELINALRSFELEREQADPAQISALRPGRRVAICAGPLKGIEGLACSIAGERVAVLLDLLGRQHSVNILNHHLEVLDA